MSDLTQAILNLENDLNAEEIARLTRDSGSQWPARLIEDYLTKIENILRLARSLDQNNDTTGFLLSQDGLTDTTALKSARRLDNAQEGGVNPVRERRDTQDSINNVSRRERREELLIPLQRRDSSIEHYAFQQRRESNESHELSLPSRVKRLSIDDLSVESIIAGNISANVNATPANTVAQLELKDKAGTTYYLPLYGAPW